MMNTADILDAVRKDKLDIYRMDDDQEGPWDKQKEQLVAAEIKCRLSIKSVSANVQGENYAVVSKVMSVFCRPEVDIHKGDRLVITTAAGQVYDLYAGQPRVLAGSHLEVAVQEDEHV